MLAVIYLDLDGFKALNDAYGHDTGDRLLNLVAVRLTHAVRAEDLVGRLGGDEYVCLITGVSSRERLQHIAATLFEAVSHSFTIGTLVLTVRPSIGIAVYPIDGITANALLQAADCEMYQVKRSKSVCAFSKEVRAAHIDAKQLIEVRFICRGERSDATERQPVCEHQSACLRCDSREGAAARPAVRRGRRVNFSSVAPELRVTERHSAADFGSSG